jgi:ABC-type polysaccharide/polyol phosphate export permease
VERHTHVVVLAKALDPMAGAPHLIIREIYSRFGPESLGFAWIVAEPLVFALPVLFVWRAIRDPNERGLSPVPFIWSGYLPLLLFRHLGGRIIYFIRANVPLLYHQRVKILDIFRARALLECPASAPVRQKGRVEEGRISGPS